MDFLKSEGAKSTGDDGKLIRGCALVEASITTAGVGVLNVQVVTLRRS